MTVQFTPPRPIDDQAEMDRARQARAFRDDGGTPEWRGRQRLRRLVLMWFGIRIVFFFPLFFTITAPIALIAAFIGAIFFTFASPLPWLIGALAAFYFLCSLLREAGVAVWLGPIRLRNPTPPDSWLEATLGGLAEGFRAVYCCYVIMFYAVATVVAIAAASSAFKGP